MEEFIPKGRTRKGYSQRSIEIDISNMSVGEFKAIIIRILTRLEKNMDDIRETLTTEIRELKIN